MAVYTHTDQLCYDHHVFGDGPAASEPRGSGRGGRHVWSDLHAGLPPAPSGGPLSRSSETSCWLTAGSFETDSGSRHSLPRVVEGHFLQCTLHVETLFA